VGGGFEPWKKSRSPARAEGQSQNGLKGREGLRGVSKKVACGGRREGQAGDFLYGERKLF